MIRHYYRLLFTTITFHFGCNYAGCGNKVSEVEKSKMDSTCSNSKSISRLGFEFYGYSDSVMSSVLVKEINQLSHDTVLYTLSLHKMQDENQGFMATLKDTVGKNNFFLIYIKGDTLHWFKDLKTVLVPTFDRVNENYSCELGSYTLNGIKTERNKIFLVKK